MKSDAEVRARGVRNGDAVSLALATSLMNHNTSSGTHVLTWTIRECCVASFRVLLCYNSDSFLFVFLFHFIN